LDFSCWDPYDDSSATICYTAFLEGLFGDDWTLNPSVFDFSTGFRPTNDVSGLLASDWTFTSPNTLTVQLRQNVYWQNISPVNGRQFTSADVVYNFDREFGLGGLTASPYAGNNPITPILTSATATDKFTVAFQFNTTNIEDILESMEALNGSPMVAQEAVTAYGIVNNWHDAVGTGPFILSDFVDDSSVTFVKNPNYWGYDERYPQNQLPYIDGIKILIMPTTATALAALRTGKIDVMEGLSLQDSENLQKSNPEILHLTMPGQQALSIDPRDDLTPYNNINVRIALQEAINLPQIASSYYDNTCSPDPQTLTSYQLTGWGFPYDQWPSSLQAQYAYNPTNAKALLAAAGYPNGFNTNCVADDSGDMELLQIVQSNLAAINVNMTITPMDPTSWDGYVFTSHSQTGLAYRSAGTLGFSFQPFIQFLLYQTGFPGNYCDASNAAFDALFPEALAATSVDQVKTLLTQANEIVSQQQFVISLLNPSSFNVYQPWLNGYAGQTFAMTGGSSGPMMIGFYASRYWINTSMQ
jgi:peptide/nickel transport system substrate-binding protein